MPLPVQHQALQEVRPAQERAVVRGRAADDDMVAPARAGMAAIDHELVGAEAALAGCLVDGGGGRDAILPARRRVDIDLDDAGIGRDANDVEARIVRRRVALDMHRQADVPRRGFGGGDEFQIILQRLDRRQENAEPAVAHFDRHRSADLAFDLADLLLDALLLFGRRGEGRLRLGARVDLVAGRWCLWPR